MVCTVGSTFIATLDLSLVAHDYQNVLRTGVRLLLEQTPRRELVAKLLKTFPVDAKIVIADPRG